MRMRIGDAEETALAAQAPIQHNRFHKMDPLNEPLRFCFLSALLISQVLQGFRLSNESVLTFAERNSNSREIICIVFRFSQFDYSPSGLSPARRHKRHSGNHLASLSGKFKLEQPRL
jgi:hypothetical protein